MIGARLLFITLLTKNTFSKRTQFLLLYSLFTIPMNYSLPVKRKVPYMSGKLSMSVLYWIFSNHLHSHGIHCKRRGMQQCHVFLNCCHVEKMTQILKHHRSTFNSCWNNGYSKIVTPILDAILEMTPFPMSESSRLSVCHLTWQILPKAVRKPFESICLGLGGFWS